MFNKQKIKTFIFSIIIFTFLINLADLSYERIYRNGDYIIYNSEVVNNYSENNYPNASLEFRKESICSNLKFPFGEIKIYYKLLMLSILATIISLITVFISLIIFLLSLIFEKHKERIFSYNDILFIVTLELISFLSAIWFFTFEPDYSFIYCVHFL